MFKKMPAVGGVSSLKCVKMHIPGSTGDGWDLTAVTGGATGVDRTDEGVPFST